MIDWKKSYNTGIDSIDLQHKKLFDILKQALVLINENSSRVVKDYEYLTILEKLAAYSEYHFKHEEKLMKETKFSGFDAHREIHQEFKEQLLLFSEGRHDPVRIAVYLQEWLIKHISGVDREYVQHFKNNLIN